MLDNFFPPPVFVYAMQYNDDDDELNLNHNMFVPTRIYIVFHLMLERASLKHLLFIYF